VRTFSSELSALWTARVPRRLERMAPRLLPDRVAAALERAHRALPAPVHDAAFDDGSDLLTLAGTLDDRDPNASEASRELYSETLRVTQGVRACAVLVLWRAATTHEWVTAACAVLALDIMDVYRAVFMVASQRVLMTKRHEGHLREQLARDVLGLTRLRAVAGAVRDEAKGMIATFDPIAMALEEGSAGTFTIKQHVIGFGVTTFWVALFVALAAPKLTRVWKCFLGLRRSAAAGFREKSRRRVEATAPRANDDASRRENDRDDTRIEKEDPSDVLSGDDGWAGPDRSYWDVFALEGDAGAGARERARFLETAGTALVFLSRRYGSFLTSAESTAPISFARGMAQTTRVGTRAVAVAALVGAIDANWR